MSSSIRVFLRDCQNNRTTPEEFINIITQNYEKSDIGEAALLLLDFCGNPNLSSIKDFFLQYLVSIANADLSYINIYRIHESPEKVRGFLYFVKEFGDKLFNNYDIGTKESAVFAIDIFRTILLGEQKDTKLIKAAVSKLSQSFKFSILIASSRVYARESFLSARQAFVDLDVYRSKISPPTIGLQYFYSALFSQNIEYNQVIGLQHENLKFFSSLILILKASNFSYPNFSMIVFYAYAYVLIQLYIESPSLHLAFFIISIAEHFNHGNNIIPNLENNISNRQISLRTFFNCLYKNSLACFENPYSTSSLFLTVKKRDEFWKLFPSEKSIKHITDLFTTLPQDTYNSLITFKTALQYPIIVPDLPDLIINAFDNNNISNSLFYIDCIRENELDFVHILLYQNKLSKFFISLQRITLNLDDNNFTQFWFTLLSIYYHLWNSGSKKIREICTDFLNRIDFKLRDFLQLLTGTSNSFIEYSTLSPQDDAFSKEKFLEKNDFDFFSPDDQLFSTTRINFSEKMFDKVIELTSALFRDNDISFFSSKLEEMPFLWPSAILWGIITNNKNALELTKKQFPKYKFLIDLFQQMIFKLTRPKASMESWDGWKIYSNTNNYDLIIEHPPSDIEKLFQKLLEDLNNFPKCSYVKAEQLFTLSISWRAYIKIFTLETFIKSMLSFLIWDINIKDSINDSIKICQAAAILICLAIEEDNNDLLFIANSVLETFNYEKHNTKTSICLTYFYITILFGLNDNFDKGIEGFNRFKDNLSSQDIEEDSPSMIFFVQTVKILHYNSSISYNISKEMFNSVFFSHSSQVGIDFFIKIEQENFGSLK